MLYLPVSNILRSAKRGKKERLGVHTWHPYYAAYSEDFVASAIAYLKLKQSDIILDPWNGSGTTGLIASKLGLQSIGCEINPVMNIFASAKNGCLTVKNFEIGKIVETIIENGLDHIVNIDDQDPLLDFMSKNLCQNVRTIYFYLNRLQYSRYVVSQDLLKPLNSIKTILNPLESFLKAALFITSRKLAGYKGGSNPTWIKKLSQKPDYSSDRFLLEFQNTVSSMLIDLKDSHIINSKNIFHLPIEADSQKLPILDSSINAIIASPPYLTRIDYAISTKPELLVISNLENLRQIREKMIGSPVIVNKQITPSDYWGETCQKILEYVKNHSSKAAKTYYLPNMLQYFRGIELSIREIKRVLTLNGKALVVVQSSYFKECEIDLGQIYTEMGGKIGLDSQIVKREIIRSHMAHINTKSNQYKARKVYFEDVVLFSK